MTEKNLVINIKNKNGTIFTFRGDTIAEAEGVMMSFISENTAATVADLEALLLGAAPTQAAPSDPLAVVQAAFPGSTVVPPAPAFAPVAPPQTASVGQRTCQHGPMTPRKGMGAKGEWKGLFCPTPKGTAGQCDPVWLNRKDPEWAGI